MSKQVSSYNSSGGIGFLDLLTIVFVTLKLLGKIDWSWWWVLSPVWIFTLIFISIFALIELFLFLRDRKK